MFTLLVIPPVSVTKQIQSDEQISSSVDIPEQTRGVSTVPISLPSTFLVISEEVLHAKFLEVIRVISSHYSFSSCQVISCLFFLNVSR